jgi:hypothetical protein
LSYLCTIFHKNVYRPGSSLCRDTGTIGQYIYIALQPELGLSFDYGQSVPGAVPLAVDYPDTYLAFVLMDMAHELVQSNPGVVDSHPMQIQLSHYRYLST